MDWTQDPEASGLTHVVRDDAETYYCAAPGWTLQAVADAFLSGYEARDETETAPVVFSVDAIGDVHAAMFYGLPNGSARKTGELLRPY